MENPIPITRYIGAEDARKGKPYNLLKNPTFQNWTVQTGLCEYQVQEDRITFKHKKSGSTVTVRTDKLKNIEVTVQTPNYEHSSDEVFNDLSRTLELKGFSSRRLHVCPPLEKIREEMKNVPATN